MRRYRRTPTPESRRLGAEGEALEERGDALEGEAGDGPVGEVGEADEAIAQLVALAAVLARTREPAARPGAPAQGSPQAPGNAEDDRLVFSQLRAQIEAYVRRAAQGYGLPDPGGDPARLLDALRRSGLVDEANLSIAERILALTDRVAAAGSAAIEDYRQALTLYLLYHRSHLGS